MWILFTATSLQGDFLSKLILQFALNESRMCPLKYAWVKSHTDVTETGEWYVLNRAVDVCCGHERQNPTQILLDEAWNDVDDFFLLFKDDLFEGNIRDSVYKMVIEKEKEIIRQYDRSGRLDFKNYWSAALYDSLKNNFEDDYFKAFHFKCVTKSLPTLLNMRRYFGNMYEEVCCPGCTDLNEDDIHVFSKCPYYDGIRIQIRQEILDLVGEHSPFPSHYISHRVPNWIKDDELWFLGRIGKYVKTIIVNLLSDKKEKGILGRKLVSCVLRGAHTLWLQRCKQYRSQGLVYEDRLLDFEQEVNEELLVSDEDMDIEPSYIEDLN